MYVGVRVGVIVGVVVGVRVIVGVREGVWVGVTVDVAVAVLDGVVVGVEVTVGVAVRVGTGVKSPTITSTGARRSVVELSPNCPLELSPQHLTVPDCITAHECAIPEATNETPLVKPKTSVGDGSEFTFDPEPIWPSLLSPQHFTPFALVRTQLW